MDASVELIGDRPQSGLTWAQMRADVTRDTRMIVQRNVAGHFHITFGNGGGLTLILHPHAAKRLIANMTAVQDGAEYGAD